MITSKKTTIGIVSPCFNEEEMLSETTIALNDLINNLISEDIISKESFIVFVDDGSTDRTWQIIESSAVEYKRIHGLKLAANVGHQKALLAGLLSYNEMADALISIDADLQDDISVIKEMILKFNSGIDTIFGVRKERTTDTFFKRFTAQLFYKFMLLMKVNIVYNHADYRLCSKRVISSLKNYKESNLFLRGIIPLIGFQTDVVYYSRQKRNAGESKYTLGKMISFAWNGITSFSSFPLKLVSTIGFLIFLLCIFMSFYALYAMIVGSNVPGWLSTVLPMYFLGGIQLFCFGIIGEYVGKIYSEVKQRPLFNIEKRI